MENEHRRHQSRRRVVVVVVKTFPRRTDLLYTLLERERKREKLVCKILMRCCNFKRHKCEKQVCVTDDYVQVHHAETNHNIYGKIY